MINDINMGTFCPLAFSQFDHRVNSFCCFNKLLPDKTHRGKSFTELMNYPESKQLQEDLINGVRNPLCKSCWDTEDNGGDSMRIMRTRGISKDTALEIVNDRKLRYLVIDSGITCNLACRTCSKWNSSSHIKEDAIRRTELNKGNDFPVTVRPTYEKLLSEDMTYVEYVEVLGGEPFLNLDHLDVIDLIASNSKEDITIHYCSNGTVRIPERILAIMHKFVNFDLTLSIDALNREFEYIRSLGKWDTLMDNIENINMLSNYHENLNVSVNVAVSALNIMQIPTLHAWVLDNKFTYSQTYVSNATHYSFDIFNDNQKSQLISLLEGNKDESNYFVLGELIQLITRSSFKQESLDRFWWEADFTKRYRGMDIQEYLPGLVSLLHQ